MVVRGQVARAGGIGSWHSTTTVTTPFGTISWAPRTSMKLVAFYFFLSIFVIPASADTAFASVMVTTTDSTPVNTTLYRPSQPPLDVERYPIAPSELALEQVHIYVRHGEHSHPLVQAHLHIPQANAHRLAYDSQTPQRRYPNTGQCATRRDASRRR